MFNDIVNSIKATLYSRTSSPLFGSLLVSWAVWNYRLLVVLLGDGKYQEKLAYIDDVIYPSWWHVLGLGFAGPVATALAFIYLYPRPALAIFKRVTEDQKKLRETRQRIEGDQLLTVDEARVLRQQHVALQVQFDGQVKSIQDERDALRGRAVQLQEESTRLKQQVVELSKVERERDDLTQELEQLRRTALSKKTLTALASEEHERRAYNLPDQEISTQALENTMWRLTFNPSLRHGTINATQGSKRLQLLPDGAVGEGRNSNEHKWRLTAEGRLELIQADGQTHSRFKYDRTTRKWLAEYEPSLGMKYPDQYIEPERAQAVKALDPTEGGKAGGGGAAIPTSIPTAAGAAER